MPHHCEIYGLLSMAILKKHTKYKFWQLSHLKMSIFFIFAKPDRKCQEASEIEGSS